jgi:hypothetical protein
MFEPPPFPIRKECPPGACECGREELLADPNADLRALRLTKEEEKRLIARIEAISELADLRRVQQRLQENLGVNLQIVPNTGEVRTTRGIGIRLEARPGLCRKARQSIPAAVRRCLEKNPGIVYAILDERDLLGDAQEPPPA